MSYCHSFIYGTIGLVFCVAKTTTKKADFAKLDNIIVGIRSVVTNKRGIEWMRDTIQTTRPHVTVVEARHSIGHWMDMFVVADTNCCYGTFTRYSSNDDKYINE